MPYIDKGVRASIDDGRKPMTPGELTYELSKVVDSYILRVGLGYRAINEAIGSLECCKLEVYRRIASKYEDKKCRENGEVFFNV